MVFPSEDTHRWGLVGTPLVMGALLTKMLGFDDFWQARVDGPLLLGLLLLLQWCFLRPRRKWIVHLTEVGRPMKTSLITAGFMAMLLTIGLAATLMELIDIWTQIAQRRWTVYIFWTVMTVLWGAWGGVFYVYWREGDRYTQMGRMVRGLLAGSVLELLVATPVQALNPNRSNCYCVLGSYTTLVFAGTVSMWCFGPGLMLLFLREKYRRQRLVARPQCWTCGYDLRGLSLDDETAACPECGQTVNIIC